MQFVHSRSDFKDGDANERDLSILISWREHSERAKKDIRRCLCHLGRVCAGWQLRTFDHFRKKFFKNEMYKEDFMSDEDERSEFPPI